MRLYTQSCTLLTTVRAGVCLPLRDEYILQRKQLSESINCRCLLKIQLSLINWTVTWIYTICFCRSLAEDMGRCAEEYINYWRTEQDPPLIFFIPLSWRQIHSISHTRTTLSSFQILQCQIGNRCWVLRFSNTNYCRCTYTLALCKPTQPLHRV